MKKILISLIAFAAPIMAQEKVLYDKDIGPESEVCDPLPPKPLKVKYRERDQDFDELPPEADWPSRHDDPYPEQLILEVHN